MKDLKESINKIIKITESEEIRFKITMQLADFIIDLQQKEFNRGLDQGTEMTKKVFTNSK